MGQFPGFTGRIASSDFSPLFPGPSVALGLRYLRLEILFAPKATIPRRSALGRAHFTAAPNCGIPKETKRSPRFLDRPCMHAPLSDPGGTFGSDHMIRRCCLPLDPTASAPALIANVAQSRGLHAPCVRFTPPVTRRGATLGSGWWSTLPTRTFTCGLFQEAFEFLHFPDLLQAYLAHRIAYTPQRGARTRTAILDRRTLGHAHIPRRELARSCRVYARFSRLA